MSGLTGLLAYVIIWWMVLFTVLPWGIKVPEEPEPGHATSAPEKPRLVRKFTITTVIATLLWGLVYTLIESGLISFRPT